MNRNKRFSILSLMLVCVLLFNTFIINAFAATETVSIENYEYTVNEYDAAKQSENEAGVNEYLEILHSYTKYSYEEIEEMGITEGNKEIIRKIKENPQYRPSETELTSAAAEVTLNLSATVHKYASMTRVDVEWDFSWTAWPMAWQRDGVAITWSGDYIIDETSMEGRVNYGGGRIYIWEDVDHSVDIAHNGYCGEFDVVKPVDYGGGELTESNADEGEGSFSLYCYDHGHNACQIQWAYGHSVITIVPGVGVSFGASGPSLAGSITFKNGVEKLSEGLQTFRA